MSPTVMSDNTLLWVILVQKVAAEIMLWVAAATLFYWLISTLVIRYFPSRKSTDVDAHGITHELMEYFKKNKDEDGIMLSEALGRHLYASEAKKGLSTPKRKKSS